MQTLKRKAERFQQWTKQFMMSPEATKCKLTKNTILWNPISGKCIHCGSLTVTFWRRWWRRCHRWCIRRSARERSTQPCQQLRRCHRDWCGRIFSRSVWHHIHDFAPAFFWSVCWWLYPRVWILIEPPFWHLGSRCVQARSFTWWSAPLSGTIELGRDH